MEHQERDQFSELLDLLSLDNITFARNFRLVRGLDYYSGTCFEVKMGQGSQNTLLAGGRYDQLARSFGSAAPVPAVGWALGLDRCALQLDPPIKPITECVGIVAMLFGSEK